MSTISPTTASTGPSPIEVLSRIVQKYAFFVVLAAMPVIYAVLDLKNEHSLQPIAENIFQGLSNGAILALIAVGYTLVYGIIELINFAHGDVFMIGSFTTIGIVGSLGLGLTTGPLGLAFGLLVVLIVCMLVCGSMNVLIERVAYRPLRNAPPLAPLITAVGMSFILLNVGLLWRGGSPVSVPDLIRSQREIFNVAGVSIRRADVMAIGITVPLVAAAVVFINNSRLGKAMRATAQDPDAARLMGINVDTTISLTFLIGGMLAGAAGLIYGLYQTTVTFDQGFVAGLLAFTAAVMGGIGNLRGAMIGAMIIGVIQNISDERIGPSWTLAIVFAYLILIMVFKPQGLIGEQTREAG